MSDLTRVFERGCAESRVKELTERFISEMALEDMRQMAKAQRLAGEPVGMYPLDQAQTIEKFSEKARAKALETLEIDRKNVVDAKSPYITIGLKNYLRQLRNLVSENNDPFFRRTFIEKMAIPSINTPRDSSTKYSETLFTYEAYLQRANSFLEFTEYAPYFSDELKALWKQCHDLSLEIAKREELTNTLWKEAKNSAKTQETEKTEKAKVETP